MDLILLLLLIVGLGQLYLTYRLLNVLVDFKNERLEIRRIVEQEKWV